MILFLAPIQIVKRNRLTSFDRMLQLPEVFDLTIPRPHGMIRPGQPAKDAPALPGEHL